MALTQVPFGMVSATGTPSASTYLRGDGSWAAVAAGGATGVDGQVFISSGTWVCPANVTRIKLAVYGGGGGAGRNYGASAGGHGGYSTGYVTVVPGTTYTATVGAGGASPGVAGNAGGESWFGVNSSSKLIYATGGAGGPNAPQIGADGIGYLGSVRTGGSLRTRLEYLGGEEYYGSSSTAAATWTLSLGYCPGAAGWYWSSGCCSFKSSGVSGAIFLEY